MVFTLGLRHTFACLATGARIGKLFRNSNIVRFVQGGVVKTFRCAALPMLEFMIRRDDGQWFDFHYDQVPDMLHPTTFDFTVVEGWGTHRIRIADTDISFSDEDPGFQVCFEGDGIDPDTAARIVAEVAANVTAVTGQASRVVPI